MRRLFIISVLFALMIGVFISCQSTGKDESAASSNPGEVIQYRGVCQDKAAHGGNDYVLTKWLDNKDKVLVYTKEHERKNKGHVVVIEERVKPVKDQQ